MSTELLRCSRKGCGKQYDPNVATGNSCAYHSGATVFHEGLKSWSCCNELPGHRPVLDFDEFLNIPGCTTGKHMTEAPAAKPVASTPAPSTSLVPPSNISVTKTSDGKEVYTTGTPKPVSAEPSRSTTPQPPKVEEDEDDPAIAVEPGTRCKRNGCKAEFISEEESRQGDGEAAQCQYHPMPPLFREGSKGYLCCKPKVLEFEEFLKIPGCKTGRHVFAKKAKASDPTEELVRPRIDHYQTPGEVHVSIFARQVDQQRSAVQFDDEHVHLDLYLPAGKRCVQTLNLYGSIDPSASKYKVYGTKVEVTLVKVQARSWNLLEKSETLVAEPNYIFTAGGRTGSVGAKEVVLDPNNATK